MRPVTGTVTLSSSDAMDRDLLSHFTRGTCRGVVVDVGKVSAAYMGDLQRLRTWCSPSVESQPRWGVAMVMKWTCSDTGDSGINCAKCCALVVPTDYDCKTTQ